MGFSVPGPSGGVFLKQADGDVAQIIIPRDEEGYVTWREQVWDGGKYRAPMPGDKRVQSRGLAPVIVVDEDGGMSCKILDRPAAFWHKIRQCASKRRGGLLSTLWLVGVTKSSDKTEYSVLPGAYLTASQIEEAAAVELLEVR